MFSDRSSGSLLGKLLVVLIVFVLLCLARSSSIVEGLIGLGDDGFQVDFGGLSSRFLNVLYDVFAGLMPAFSLLMLLGLVVAWRRGYLRSTCIFLRDGLTSLFGRRESPSLTYVAVESAPVLEKRAKPVDGVSCGGEVVDDSFVDAIGSLTPVACRIVCVLMSCDGLTKKRLVELLSVSYPTVLKHVKVLEGGGLVEVSRERVTHGSGSHPVHVVRLSNVFRSVNVVRAFSNRCEEHGVDLVDGFEKPGLPALSSDRSEARTVPNVAELASVGNLPKEIENDEEGPGKISFLGLGFQVLGNVIVAGSRVKNVFSNLAVRTVKRWRQDIAPERFIYGLARGGDEGCFILSWGPLSYEVLFSPRASGLSLDKTLNKHLECKAKINILLKSVYGDVLTKDCPSSITYLRAPLAGVSERCDRYRNSVMFRGGDGWYAVSFLVLIWKRSLPMSWDRGLEGFLSGVAEAEIKVRLCVPYKRCKGLSNSLRLRLLKWRVSSAGSDLSREAWVRRREWGDRSTVERRLGVQEEFASTVREYEKLCEMEALGAWLCSPIVTVVAGPLSSSEEAYSKLKRDLSSVESCIACSFPVEIKGVKAWNVLKIAEALIKREVYRPHASLLSSSEMAAFIRIPESVLPSAKYSEDLEPEFTPPSPSELPKEGILLGRYEGVGGSVPIRLGMEDLPKHVAIFGVPGIGKTMLTKALVGRYVEQFDGKVIIFDRHGEYARDLEGFVCMRVGLDDFKLNLLDPGGEDPASYVKKLEEIFRMAFPDEFGPVMGYVLRETYLELCRLAGEAKAKPNLRSYLDFLNMLSKHRSISSDLGPRMTSHKALDKIFSLQSRLSELTCGVVGNVFDTKESSHSTGPLLSRNVILDLSGLDSDRDANLFTWTVLALILRHVRLRENAGLPHLIVCEEAHNVAPVKYEGEPTVIEYMLKELRKYGESVWLIDQRPLSISREALGLCSTIICLRLQYASDTGKIADTLHLTEPQSQHLQRLGKNEAVVLLSGAKNAIPIKLQGGTAEVN